MFLPRKQNFRTQTQYENVIERLGKTHMDNLKCIEYPYYSRCPRAA